MVDIRCTAGIQSNQEPGSIITEEGEILTFPQGEVEYSIYRGADGKDLDLIFSGYNEDQLAEAQAILDTLDLPRTGFVGDTKVVFTTKKEQLSNISQAIHSNPAYYQQIKAQFEEQICPRYSTNLDGIPLGPLLSFMRKYLIETPDREINKNEALLARPPLSTGTDSAYNVFSQTLGFGILANLEPADFNQRFSDQVIREEERQRIAKCFAYYDTGVVPEGELLRFAIDVDTSSSSGTQDETIRFIRNTRGERTSRPSGYKSIHEALSSSPQFFFYKAEVGERHQNTFKTDLLSAEDLQFRIDSGKVRFNRDVHASDFFITEYNTNTPPSVT